MNIPLGIPIARNKLSYKACYFYDEDCLAVRYDSSDGQQKAVIPYARSAEGWVSKAPPAPRILYGHQALQEADPDTPVYIVEGEKCAEALLSLGLFATTSIGGSNGASKSDWSILSHYRTIYILADNDEAGQKYAQEVSLHLQLLNGSREVFVINLPDLEEGGDVVDWVQYILPGWDGFSPVPVEHREATTKKLLATIEEHKIPAMDLWEDIVPFNEIETPEIPASLLPYPFGEYAEALANEFEVPEAMTVMGILGAISAAVTGSFKVSPKPMWMESINTYTLIALPPANNKSAVLKRLSSPIVAWEDELDKILGPEIKRQESKYKSALALIESKRRESVKPDNMANFAQLQEEIAKLESQLEPPSKLPKRFITDATPEALSDFIHEQGGKGAVITDEGGIIETCSGLYTGGRSANIDILLKGIDGGETRIKRKDKDCKINPYLTMLLIVQPQILINIQSKDAFTGKGFVERFLYVVPKSKLGYRTLNQPSVPPELESEYSRLILNLLQLNCADEGSVVLKLSPEASSKFQDFRHQIEKELRPNGSLHDYGTWAGKICGYCLRIAGQLHMAEYIANYSTVIGASTMESAIQIMELLIQHTKAAFAMVGADKAAIDAKNVMEWASSNRLRHFTKTQFTTHFKNWDVKRREKALAKLLEHNLLELCKGVAKTYIVNPKAYEVGKGEHIN